MSPVSVGVWFRRKDNRLAGHAMQRNGRSSRLHGRRQNVAIPGISAQLDAANPLAGEAVIG